MEKSHQYKIAIGRKDRRDKGYHTPAIKSIDNEGTENRATKRGDFKTEKLKACYIDLHEMCLTYIVRYIHPLVTELTMLSTAADVLC